MAKIAIEQSFVRTPDQESRLLEAAAGLPPEWSVAIGPAKVSRDGVTGDWEIRVEGAAIPRRIFGAEEDVEEAVRYLRNIRP